MTLSIRDHIALLQTSDQLMLVSVAALRGSTPREAGAFMLISPNGISGTIGGGNLEHQVTRRVRDFFAKGDGDLPDAGIVRFPLGPGLGQCCGGSVEIGFHLLAADGKEILRAALQGLENVSCGVMGCWLSVPVEGRDIAIIDGPYAGLLTNQFGSTRGGVVSVNGVQTLCLRLDDARTPIFVFGAGHVGKAIVTALAPLPFDIHLIDEREEFLSGRDHPNIHIVHSDDAPHEVADIPPGGFVLILTHNHALDFDICRAALARDDLGFVGMIGSQTKRARFVRRFEERGFTPLEIGRMTCPIGINGVTGKQPAVIAASVAAQLLSVRETKMIQTETPHSVSNGFG
ncbi:xanthine dehydrogenase accessory protein XdhC [Thalassospira sp. MA62]|nr:xanthine dehydrogenase accessory protein XdhC [Thalassospira sp. MA62]